MIVRPALGSLPNSRSFRGQPLAIMLAVFALWIGLRASFWSPPFGSSELLAPLGALGEKVREPGVSGPKRRSGPPLAQWWRTG
ncbi:MAG: hypothetical protein KKG32_08410, partial [Alphaproteobacteria bacterium]|nr:hypothetical protein [Alphaproteobacteria bacterium]